LIVICAPDVACRLSYPFETVEGAGAYFDLVYLALFQAIPDLERREFIVVADKATKGADLVGTGGFYTRLFLQPWLDIPATGHVISMRFHEFFIVEDGQVVEMQALWDIPELMMQAQAWPMSPGLGKYWSVPGGRNCPSALQ